MSENEFRRPVSIDFAPGGSICEWCGKPATQQLTAIGGKSHNEGGYFCSSCAIEFVRTVAESTYRVPALEVEIPIPGD